MPKGRQKVDRSVGPLVVKAVKGPGYIVATGTSSVEIRVSSLTIGPPPRKPRLVLRSSDEGKGFGDRVNKIKVTFELNPPVNFPVTVALHFGGRAQRGRDYDIRDLAEDDRLKFQPNESTKAIELRRLGTASTGRGDREIVVTYDTTEVDPGTETRLPIPFADQKARLSWSLTRSTLPSAENGLSNMILSVSPPRDEDVGVRYKFVPADPQPPFSLPKPDANGYWTIKIAPGTSQAERNINVSGSDLVGGPPRTLTIETVEINPPDLRDSALPPLTLTVADEKALMGSALVVVILTDSLADDASRETLNELIAVERGLDAKLVGNHLYTLQDDGKLHRWSPRDKPFEGRKPIAILRKPFEDVLNDLEYGDP